MSDVIKKYIGCVIFEKTAMGVLPQWALCHVTLYEVHVIILYRNG